MAQQKKKKRATPRKATQRNVHGQFWASILLIIVGCACLTAGFLAPPLGEIHPTVLVAFGEILTFVGAVFGIDYHYKFKNLK